MLTQAREVTVPCRNGYDFGIGADQLSGGPLALAVQGTPTQVGQAGGSTVNFEVHQIHTTSDLEQALGVSADANYGSGLFGAGVSARFDFAKSVAVQSSSLFMAVTVTVKLGFLQIDSPQLTPQAAALVDRPDVFDARFGNSFVHGIARGGLFVGMLRIDTRSEQDSESISSELHGTYGLFSADAAERFTKITAKYSVEVYVQMYHEGGPTDLKIQTPEDPMEILKNANAFLQAFTDRPDQVAVPYEVTLAPMVIADGPLPLNAADIQHAQDVLVFCGNRRSTVMDQLNLMQFIADHASRFDYPTGSSPAQIQSAVEGLQADIDLISQCASSAINSPATAAMPADYANQHGIAFPQGKMPDVMPVPKSETPVVVPAWSTMEDIVADATDAQGNVVTRSAAEVGLVVQEVEVLDGTGSMGDIISIAPAPGSTVMTGSTVIVTYQRNAGPHDN